MKFDLHIHSVISKYKEAKGIVDNSSIDNTDTLLRKLNENNVGLFSITDHNRFDVELYKKLDREISSGYYEYVKGLVAGVEFDVRIDENMGKCHIITIFDTKNDECNYKKIKMAIDQNLLTDSMQYYEKEEFESILKKIGLDVILIACQRNGLDRSNQKTNSLSDSTINPQKLLRIGYINALEFQKPNVEGILKNNLRDISTNVGLVTGSDCHDWNSYPNHDSNSKKNKFIHSRAKISPTFKGLLMAITSPETRINQQESKNTEYISKFKLLGEEIPLANGINAIIGENGSGKSTLLKFLENGNDTPKYVKDLIKRNELCCEESYSSKKLFIGQGEIVKRFDECTLFPKENFGKIPFDSFKNAYSIYADNILAYIKNNIKAEDKKNGLKNCNLSYNVLNNNSTYFIQIKYDKDFSDVENIHDTPKKDLVEIIQRLDVMLRQSYFTQYERNIKEANRILNTIFEKIEKAYDLIETEREIKNIITSKIAIYNKKIEKAATSLEKDQRDFSVRKSNFIRRIIETINMDNEEKAFPEKPEIFQGYSQKSLCGFSFNSEAKYNDKDVHGDFLCSIFNHKYADIEKIKAINSSEELISAIKFCSSYDQIDKVYYKNITRFLDDMCECKNYIIDISNNENTLGSTLGEQSLAYFKYITEYETDKCILLVDQPEDHISNNNISKKLIEYLNSIRNTKQIIIVTHNPLLVVNLDVDQVIFVKKNNNTIDITYGCLEFENKSVNILDLIAENMDGGKESIEKRLRVYG